MLGLDNPIHILLVMVVVLLLFGAKRLPEAGRSLGTGIREFRDSVSGANKLPDPIDGSEASVTASMRSAADGADAARMTLP